tara:strand:+ start:301 stop:585 length:285 start_codon:yes stop_codon:yes gene_type:complete
MKKTYRVPVLGFINTEIDVQANSIEEAIKLTYKEMNEDTSRFQLNFYYDTIEDDVEEVDVEAEREEYELRLKDYRKALKEIEVAKALREIQECA